MVVCNQKMFLNKDEAINLKNELLKLKYDQIDFVIAPSFLNFEIFKDFKLCAQDSFYEKKGPYTAEISAYDLKERNVTYCLVGHSYRRKYDTNKIINLKVKSLLKNEITPILCIGESRKDFLLKRSKKVLKTQITLALKDVILKDNQKIIIAYEPTHLIGSGKFINGIELEKIVNYIKQILKDMSIYNYMILYGGSVNHEAIKEIETCNIQGYLLGTASESFCEIEKIIKCIKKCKQ